MALQANSRDVYKALDECHKRIAEIYVRYEKG